MFLTNEGYGTNNYELLEYINKIEPIECRVGFLQELTKQCNENDLDLYGEMICVHDGNGYLYFMNDKQIVEEFILPILSDRDFILDDKVSVKLLEILSERGEDND